LYTDIEFTLSRHKELAQRLRNLYLVIDKIEDKEVKFPAALDVPSGSGVSDFARLAFAVDHESRAEELLIPIADCLPLIQNRINELEGEFNVLDKKIKRWGKDATPEFIQKKVATP